MLRPRPALGLLCASIAFSSCRSRPAASERPGVLYIGRSAKTQVETAIQINPVMKLDGFTRQQIYDLRKREVLRHPELVDTSYRANDGIFGGIEDGKPWWGLEGFYFYGDGPKSIEGPSEESRFIANPLLLVGIRETSAIGGRTPDGSVNYYPYPTTLSWNSAKSFARVTYNVSEHFDFEINHRYPEDKAHELEFVLYNARDFGFKFFYMDPNESHGIKLTVNADKTHALPQYIHCGNSCGYPGGCNNMSPFSPALTFQMPATPAKAVLKLWLERPASVLAPADMTYSIDVI